MTVPIRRGPAPARHQEEEAVIATEFARLHRLRQNGTRRFLVRKHASVWSKLFPNRPVWLVWDRVTGQLTEWETWGHAMRHVRYLQRGWSYCKRTGGYEREERGPAVDSHYFLSASAADVIMEPSA